MPLPPGPGGPGPAPRRTSGGVLLGRILAAVVSLAVFASFAFYWSFATRTTSAVADSKGVVSAGDTGVLFRGGVNILLVGSDARTDADGNPLTAEQLKAVSTTLDDGGVNTDTIMVLHIPQGGGKATAVSLPRDTFIPTSITKTVPGPYGDGTQGPYKANKINSFYGTAKFYTEQALAKKGQGNSPARQRASNEAGRTMLIKVVQAFTGLKIDHYAEVNLIGFYTLSNAVGGVPVCLNKAVNDSFSGANFPAGAQSVQGTSAMAFVRQRHGLPNGDLDRVRRQQAFLAGATSKMLSAGVLASPAKLNQLADAAGKSLTLDSGFDLLSFAQQMSGLSGGNVTFSTIPTHGASEATSADALATDPAEIKAFFRTLDAGPGAAGPASKSTSGSASAPAGPTRTSAAPTVNPAAVTVDVKDATKGHVAGTPVMKKLAAAGFTPGSNGDQPGATQAGTTIRYGEGGAAAGRAVQAALGGAGELRQEAGLGARQVTVIVGADLAANGLRVVPGALVVPAAPAAPAAPATPAPPAPAGQALTAGSVGCVN